jgi:DNA-directed RNA polymerase subunit RPC12/RpoP
MSSNTSTICIFDVDPELVVSVTVGDLKTMLDDGMDVVNERTCHVLNPHRPNGCEGLGVFGKCSECGGEIETVDEHDRVQNPWKRPDTFCKWCGARVVGE